MSNMGDPIMNSNTKNKPKTSLIFGIFSILLPVFWIVSEVILRANILGELTGFFSKTFPLLSLVTGLIIFIVPGILAILGLILGIRSLKLVKRQGSLLGTSLTFVISGLVLCVLGLLFWLFELWIVYGIANS